MQETLFYSLPKKVEVKMEVENKEAAKDAKEGLVFYNHIYFYDSVWKFHVNRYPSKSSLEMVTLCQIYPAYISIWKHLWTPVYLISHRLKWDIRFVAMSI